MIISRKVATALLVLVVGCISGCSSREDAIRDAAHVGDSTRLVQLIKSGVDVDASDDEGRTALWYAASAGKLGSVRLLLNAGARFNLQSDHAWEGAPIHIAAANNHVQIVQALLDAGDSIDRKDAYGRSPLWHAVSQNGEETVDLLIARGANPSIGFPLHEAALNGADALVEKLLDAGAPVNAQDINGQTALHFAIGFGELGTARLLVSRGADPQIADAKGWKPLSSPTDPLQSTLLKVAPELFEERR